VRPSVVIIVQARMGSTRLPGKVLRPLLGSPMLERQLERLGRCRTADHVLVATTDNSADDAIATFVARQHNVGLYRGPEEDVLARYCQAARRASADIVVRITADCPLIEPALVDRCVLVMLAQADDFHYVSNCHRRTYPRGLDVEVVRTDALYTAEDEATETFDREHVTPYIWRRPDRFKMKDVMDSEDNSHLRWTVDTPEDFELVERIYEALYPVKAGFDYQDALRLMQAKPELQRINSHVIQKAGSL
jgi:spore coat polysaccharide biosynthesis protein SpsF